MATTVPTTSKSIPADLKGVAGSGVATTQTQIAPISLPLILREEIKRIINIYAKDKTSLTADEFQTFLKQEQHTSEVPFDGDVSAEKFEEYLLSPANVAVQVAEQDLTHSLKDYLISTSHNTYLLGNQLYGEASCEGYKTVLLKGCRCIEIDCWDGENNEPKVVHGFTAVEPITFRNVCKAIAQYSFVTSDLPVIISLEVHCNIEQQKKMVEILHEVFGAMMLTSRLEGVDLETLPSPLLLKNKILLKSKYLAPETQQAENPLVQKESSSTSVSSSEDEEELDPLIQTPSGKQSAKPPKVKILRSLSNLGVYSTSTHYHSFSDPLSKLFNHIHSFSERQFKKLLEERGSELREHNRKYLTRVYPSGLRFTSSNEEPAIFWRHGAQMVALNWQKFDLGMMQNEALFGGSGGMVLKPKYIHSPPPQPVYLTVDIIGAAGLPCPEGLKDIQKLDPYVKVELRSGETEKRETRRKKNVGANVIWNETLAFHRVSDNLAFVRFMIYHDEIGPDKMFAVYTARLDALQQGYRFLRLLDVEGKQIPGAVLMIHVRKN